MKPSVYRAALKTCSTALASNDAAKGMERIIHNALQAQLPNAKGEVKLASVGGRQAWSKGDGRVDIVDDAHGIELKAARLPRHKLSSSYSLWDLGQLATDYWRLGEATGLDSGELVVLLYGPLVSDLPNETAIYREFHNRMYIDFITSRTYGELSSDWLAKEPSDIQLQRKRQLKAIREMGFHKPCNASDLHLTVREGAFALVSILVR